MLSKKRILGLAFCFLLLAGCSTDDGSQISTNQFDPEDLLKSMRHVTFALPSDGADFVTFSPAGLIGAGQTRYTNMGAPNFTMISPDPLVLSEVFFADNRLELASSDETYKQDFHFEYLYMSDLISFAWDYYRIRFDEPEYKDALIVYAIGNADYDIQDVVTSQGVEPLDFDGFMQAIVFNNGTTSGFFLKRNDVEFPFLEVSLFGQASEFGRNFLKSDGSAFFYNENFNGNEDRGSYRLNLTY